MSELLRFEDNKKGSQSGRQRYFCHNCQRRFQYQTRRRTNWSAILWQEYVFGKQNLVELADRYQRSIPWIRKELGRHQSPSTKPYQEIKPQPTALVIDAFYFKRGDGVLVFRSPLLARNLLWFRVAYETIESYQTGIDHLEAFGWQILGVVIDGRRGLLQSLAGRFPTQMCQFHQLAIVRRYLTNKPQTSAARELLWLAGRLPHTNRSSFENELRRWFETHVDLIQIKTIHSSLTPTGRHNWSYTHRRLRSAYFSLKNNLPYLFVYRENSSIKLPNTTNSQDGSVTHIRNRIRLHCGQELNSRLKLTDALLRGKSPKKLQ